MSANERTILALRELADRLSATKFTITGDINRALSVTEGDDDADRLLTILLCAVAFDQADFDRFRADPRRQALVDRILSDEEIS